MFWKKKNKKEEKPLPSKQSFMNSSELEKKFSSITFLIFIVAVIFFTVSEQAKNINTSLFAFDVPIQTTINTTFNPFTVDRVYHEALKNSSQSIKIITPTMNNYSTFEKLVQIGISNPNTVIEVIANEKSKKFLSEKRNLFQNKNIKIYLTKEKIMYRCTIIDERKVILGDTIESIEGTDYVNLFIIPSSDIAKVYLNQFEEIKKGLTILVNHNKSS